LREFELGEIQGVEGFAKMHQHQVAFVTEHSEQARGFLLVVFHATKFCRGLVENRVLLGSAEGAPSGPAHAKHLMEQIRAVESQRCWRQMVC
jgi:hypothetical protein